MSFSFQQKLYSRSYNPLNSQSETNQTMPFFTSPSFSMCPKRKYAGEDPYASRWKQAELSGRIVSRMQRDFNEMENNPNLQKSKSSLIGSYCPKTMQKKNVIESYNFTVEDLERNEKAEMEIDWSLEEERAKHERELYLKNISELEESKPEQKEMEKIEFKTIKKNENRLKMKMTFGSDEFIPFKDKKEEDALHDHQGKQNVIYPSSITYKNREFKRLDIQS